MNLYLLAINAVEKGVKTFSNTFNKQKVKTHFCNHNSRVVDKFSHVLALTLLLTEELSIFPCAVFLLL